MSSGSPTANQQLVRMMTHYMAWANSLMLESAARLPEAELIKPRQALFGNIAHTFNHILVIEKIFQAHLEGRSHPYTARNTEAAPPFAEVRRELESMDRYYVSLAATLSAEALSEDIEFTFVGGGRMTRMEILLHMVNHATYHRGFVSDMMYQIPHQAGANDLPVFLRDAWPGIQTTEAAGAGA